LRSERSRSNRACASSWRPSSSRQSTSQNEQGQEDSLARGQAVDLARRVAQNEPVAAEVALDRLDRADDAGIVRGQEPDERDHQARRVEHLPAVVLRERAQLRVEALPADLVVDLVQ